MSHIPVMLDEMLYALSPKDGETYIDGTFGAGGYAKAILNAADCQLFALDRDPHSRPYAEKIAQEFTSRFSFSHIEFSKMEQVLSGEKVDGVVLDIGVSSMQIDEDMRGFSFMKDGPLDMRMSGVGLSAENVIKHMSHSDLTRLFKVYGEERRARRCADFIVRAREQNPVKTTGELADIISTALGRSGKRHPATKIFQALRIFINDELGELVRALLAAERVLKPGGRLVVISFHSLEDRIVKSFFRAKSGEKKGGSRYFPPQDLGHDAGHKTGENASFILKKRSGIGPAQAEASKNPRSRSARLRWAVRTKAPAGGISENLLPDIVHVDTFSEAVL